MSKSKSANKAGGAQAYKKLLRRIERLEFKIAMIDDLLRLMRDLEFHWRGTPGFTEDENNQFLLLMNSFFDALDDYIRAEEVGVLPIHLGAAKATHICDLLIDIVPPKHKGTLSIKRTKQPPQSILNDYHLDFSQPLKIGD